MRVGLGRSGPVEERGREPLGLAYSECCVDPLTFEVLVNLLAGLRDRVLGEEGGDGVDEVGFVEGGDAGQHAWDRVRREALVEIIPVGGDEIPHPSGDRSTPERTGDQVGGVLGAHGAVGDVGEKSLGEFDRTEAGEGPLVADFGDGVGRLDDRRLSLDLSLDLSRPLDLDLDPRLPLSFSPPSFPS